MNETMFAHQIALEAKQGLAQHDMDEVRQEIVVQASCGGKTAKVETNDLLTTEFLNHLDDFGIKMTDQKQDHETGNCHYEFDFSGLEV